MNFFNKVKKAAASAILKISKFVKKKGYQRSLKRLLKRESKLEKEAEKRNRQAERADQKLQNTREQIKASERERETIADVETSDDQLVPTEILLDHWNNLTSDKSLRELYNYSFLSQRWDGFLFYLRDKKGGIGLVYGIEVSTRFEAIWFGIILEYIDGIRNAYELGIRNGQYISINEIDDLFDKMIQENNEHLIFIGWREFQDLLENFDYPFAFEEWRTLRSLVGERTDTSL